MQIFYCDQCGLRVPPKELEGEALPEGRKIVCEKCRAKQETSALGMRRDSRSKVISAARRTRRSSAILKPAKRASGGHPIPRAAARVPAVPSVAAERAPRLIRSKPVPNANKNMGLVMGLLGGVLLLAGGVLIFRGDAISAGPPEGPGGNAFAAAETRGGSAQSHPVPPEGPSTSALPPPPPPVAADPAVPPPEIVSDTPEKIARKAYDELLRFEGLEPADRTGRMRRIEAFLAEHGQTIIAAQVRVRLEKLKKEAATSVSSTPSTPSTVTAPASTTASGEILLVRFGASEAASQFFRPEEFSAVFKDTYDRFTADGGGGIASHTNTGYDYAGIEGKGRLFQAGDQVIVKIYNRGKTDLLLQPRLSLTFKGRVNSQFKSMDNVVLPAGQTRAYAYTISDGDAGRHTLINIAFAYRIPSTDHAVRSAVLQSIAVRSAAAVPGGLNTLTEGLVLHLKLDETDGTAAADASGKGHNGTLENGPVWAAGKIGGALRFDGKDDRVIVENVPVNTAPGAQNTVAFWMKWNGYDNQMPFAWGSSYDLYLQGGNIGFNTGDSNILGFSSAGLAGRWVHVTAIFFNGVPSPSNSKLYIDGNEKNIKDLLNLTTRSSAVASRIVLSGWKDKGQYKFDGMLDDLRVYNRALSPEEIRALSNGKTAFAAAPVLSGNDSLTKGLVLYLKLDETDGVAAADVSGKNHNGTLQGGPVWAAGKAGGALRFDGKDDQVIVDGVPVNAAPGAPNTVAFWMKWNGRGSQMPFAWGSNYDLYIQGGSIGFNTGEGGNIIGCSSVGLAKRWVHVAAIFFNGVPAASNSKIYINGVERSLDRRIGTTTRAVTAAPKIYLSGIRGGYRFGGMLDEVRIYNRALSPREIQSLAQGQAAKPPPAAVQAEDREARFKSLKRARALWHAGGVEALEAQAQTLEGSADPQEKALAQAIREALNFRAAAAQHLKSLEGQEGVTLTFKKDGRRRGTIRQVEGARFTFQGAVTQSHRRLAELSLATQREWVSKQLKEPLRLPVLTAAAALLEANPSEASSALTEAAAAAESWKPWLGVLKAVAAQAQNESAWTQLEKLAQPGRWKVFVEKAAAFLKAPPGGALAAELKKKVQAALDQAHQALGAKLLKAKLASLAGRWRMRPDGQVELSYDFLNPRQLLDFGAYSYRVARLQAGALWLRVHGVGHVLPFAGDLAYSFEAASTTTPPNRIYLRFYDYTGEFGGSDNKWTAIWKAGQAWERALGKKDGVKITAGKWHHIEITYKAAEKRTRLKIDGQAVLNFRDARAAGKGHVFLGCRDGVKIRNLRIRGTPDFEAIQKQERKKEFSRKWVKKLRAGRFVKIFTQEDREFWNISKGRKWSLSGGVVSGKGGLSLPGFSVPNYELKLEMRLVSGNEFALNVRGNKKTAYQLLFLKDKVIARTADHFKHAWKKLTKDIKTNGQTFHKIHVLSRGKFLRVILDEKKVLMDLKNVPLDAWGFSIGTWKGTGAFRNAEARFLR